MDSSTGPSFTMGGAIDSRPSNPTRLCCALTRLSQALATCVPRTEMRIDYLRGVCDCQAFRTEETGCHSGDVAS